MKNIRNLNIWKVKGDNDNPVMREIVLEDASIRKESFITMKCEEIFLEIMKLVPEADIAEIKHRRGGKFRYPMYISNKLNTTDIDALELSVRANHCLHRAGFVTVGDLVANINGSEDLKKIRSCGAKTVDEIMEQLFCYQYMQLKEEKKVKYIRRILELNCGRYNEK